MTGRRAAGGRLVVFAIALAAVAALHLLWARGGLGFSAALDALLGGGTERDRFVLHQIRLPRTLVALFGGAALSLAGAAMQAAFRNPLASPDVIGTNAGAALGGAWAIVGGLAAGSIFAVPLCSLGGAGLVTWLVFVMAGRGQRFSVTALLLAGVAMNTLMGAITSFVVALNVGNYQSSSEVLFWLMGGLDARTWEHAWITGGGCLVCGALLVPLLRELDVLTLRDDTARSLGLDAAAVRQRVLLLACGLSACTVANTGGIAFVGLVVPHAARLRVGPSHRVLLPASALLGGTLLLLADLCCRLAPPEANLRLGVLTSLLGAPYFLYLLVRHRRGAIA